MTQQEYENKIKELQDELEKLKAAKIADSGKRWKPKQNETYWFISSGGIIANTDWCDGDTTDDWYYLTGNCFKNEEEAEERKKQIEYTARYKNYIEEHSKPLNWEDYNQEKYLADFDFRNHSVGVDWGHLIKKQGTIYASSEQIIRDAIKEIGEDNFKKYVLGVK